MTALDRQFIPYYSFHGSPLPRVVPYPFPAPHPLCLTGIHRSDAFGDRLVQPVFELPDHSAAAVEVVIADVAEKVTGERSVGVGQPRQRHLGRRRERDDRGPPIGRVGTAGYPA